jgi:hypothetical protein
MLQVMCSRDTKRTCDGSCDDPGCIAKHRPTITVTCCDCDRLRAERDETRKLYHDLIMQVERKFPHESRHDTARRYIHDAEHQDCGTEYAADSAPPNTQANRTNPQG